MTVEEQLLAVGDLERPVETDWQVLTHDCQPDQSGWLAADLLTPGQSWPDEVRLARAGTSLPASVDELVGLARCRLGQPFARVVQNTGAVLPTLDYRLGPQPMPGVVDLARARRAESSIVLQHADWISEPLRRHCHGLARWTQAMVGANVYLTPPGAQGLSPHFDTHGVIVVQCAGRKRWRLHRQAVLDPDPDMTSESLGLCEEDLVVADPTEIVLEVGDALWVPAGRVHEASSEATSTSIHITFAVQALPLHHIESSLRTRRFAAPGFMGPDRSEQPSHRAQWWSLWGMNTTSPRPLAVAPPLNGLVRAVKLDRDAVNAIGNAPSGALLMHCGDRIVENSGQARQLCEELLTNGWLEVSDAASMMGDRQAQEIISAWHRFGVITTHRSGT